MTFMALDPAGSCVEMIRDPLRQTPTNPHGLRTPHQYEAERQQARRSSDPIPRLTREDDTAYRAEQAMAGAQANGRFWRTHGWQSDTHGNATNDRVVAAPKPTSAPTISDYSEAVAAHYRSLGHEVDATGAPLPQNPDEPGPPASSKKFWTALGFEVHPKTGAPLRKL
jgi:hypothetical protein